MVVPAVSRGCAQLKAWLGLPSGSKMAFSWPLAGGLGSWPLDAGGSSVLKHGSRLPAAGDSRRVGGLAWRRTCYSPVAEHAAALVRKGRPSRAICRRGCHLASARVWTVWSGRDNRHCVLGTSSFLKSKTWVLETSAGERVQQGENKTAEPAAGEPQHRPGRPARHTAAIASDAERKRENACVCISATSAEKRAATRRSGLGAKTA